MVHSKKKIYIYILWLFWWYYYSIFTIRRTCTDKRNRQSGRRVQYGPRRSPPITCTGPAVAHSLGASSSHRVVFMAGPRVSHDQREWFLFLFLFFFSFFNSNLTLWRMGNGNLKSGFPLHVPVKCKFCAKT